MASAVSFSLCSSSHEPRPSALPGEGMRPACCMQGRHAACTPSACSTLAASSRLVLSGMACCSSRYTTYSNRNETSSKVIVAARHPFQTTATLPAVPEAFNVESGASTCSVLIEGGLRLSLLPYVMDARSASFWHCFEMRVYSRVEASASISSLACVIRLASGSFCVYTIA